MRTSLPSLSTVVLAAICGLALNAPSVPNSVSKIMYPWLRVT
jgi:hypothetical protein